jgi:DNA-binding GntR family transcriptional regulator
MELHKKALDALKARDSNALRQAISEDILTAKLRLESRIKREQ